MNSLKAALGKQDKKSDKVTSNASVSRKKFSNSKSQSMWALQMDEKNVQISLVTDQKLQLLNTLLKSAYQKDHKLTHNIFDRIVQDFQQQIGTSSSKAEISYYLVLQDKITDLIQLYSKEKTQLKSYLEQFHQNVQERISLLRSKDKSVHLKNFDKIADTNFKKKKTDYLDIKDINVDNQIKIRQKSKGQNKSNQKKLNRLFSKQKGLKDKPSLKHAQSDNHDDYLLSQSVMQSNESVSYSAIMSSSVAVKQRRPRKKSTKCEDYLMSKTDEKDKKTVQNEQQHDKTDKAFIFYRPKKNAKN